VPQASTPRPAAPKSPPPSPSAPCWRPNRVGPDCPRPRPLDARARPGAAALPAWLRVHGRPDARPHRYRATVSACALVDLFQLVVILSLLFVKCHYSSLLVAGLQLLRSSALVCCLHSCIAACEFVTANCHLLCACIYNVLSILLSCICPGLRSGSGSRPISLLFLPAFIRFL
jgi:hypothetical protein